MSMESMIRQKKYYKRKMESARRRCVSAEKVCEAAILARSKCECGSAEAVALDIAIAAWKAIKCTQSS